MMRFTGIHIKTPAESLQRIQWFNERIDRLVADAYSNPRFRTQDLNALKHDLRFIHTDASIAVHAKNQERARLILQGCSDRMRTARKLHDDYEIVLYQRENKAQE